MRLHINQEQNTKILYFMNLRTIFISSFLSLSSLGVLAQERINLSGTWQFAFAANQKEADRLERFYTSDFAKSKFKSTPVPSNWALLGYEEPVYRGFKDNQAGEGFYVREFTIPQDWKDKRILLHFGGVWSSAEVWLNGNELGRHDCGYTSFAFDVTNKLKVDEPNKLAVRVRQITREYKFDVCDDWTWGGIYRDVTLEAMPAKRWIDDVVVQTTFDHLFQDANLDIRVMISDKHKNTCPEIILVPASLISYVSHSLTKKAKRWHKDKWLYLPMFRRIGRFV